MSTTKSSSSPADRAARTQSSYDAVAEEYAEHISDELDHRPEERGFLQRFARRHLDRGWVCDLGCGPGHITRYLRRFNPDVFGLDISLGLLRQACRRHSGVQFLQGDMLALPFASGALGGIVAFYSIIHFDSQQVDQALAEMRRVLRPQGHLLLGFHVGREVVHVDELWGVSVDLDATFFAVDDLAGRLARMDFDIVEQFEREPHPEVEYQSVRGYIWSEKLG